MTIKHSIHALLASFFMSSAAFGLINVDSSETKEPDAPCIGNCTFTAISLEMVNAIKSTPAEMPAMEITTRYLGSAAADELISCGGADLITVKKIQPSTSNTGSTYHLGSDFFGACTGPVVVKVVSYSRIHLPSVTIRSLGNRSVSPFSSPVLGAYCGLPGTACPPPVPPVFDEKGPSASCPRCVWH